LKAASADGKTIGHFTGRGFVPEFYEELVAVGIPLDTTIFSDGMSAEALQARA
jgi:hypothetical protein